MRQIKLSWNEFLEEIRIVRDFATQSDAHSYGKTYIGLSVTPELSLYLLHC